MPSKFWKAIGAVKDQTSISLAKVSTNNSSSSNIEIAVLKATTHEDKPLKDKHVNTLLRIISSSSPSAAACAHVIARRIGRTRNWVVALKSLMLVFRLFREGDPNFQHEVLQAMKGGAKILNISNFRDDSSSSPWDYTAYVRTYALYLDERLESFVTGNLHRRAVYNNGARKNEAAVCDMMPPMLIDRICCWQRMLDRVIATRPTGAAKTNHLVQISLNSIVQESFDFYRDVSEGLKLLLDSFFQLQYQACYDAFQTCVKASKQFEELSAFYTTCKLLGVGRSSEYPSIQKFADELIDTLRGFLRDKASFSKGNPRSKLKPPPLLLGPPSNEADSLESSTERTEPSYRQQLHTSEEHLEGGSDTTSPDPVSITDSNTISSDSTDQDQVEKQSQLEDLNTATSKIEAGTCPSTLPVDQTGTYSGGQHIVLFIDDDDEQPLQAEAKDSGREGWELILADTANDLVPSSSSQWDFEATFQEPSYNPFLQDISGITEGHNTNDPVAGDIGFASLRTFQAPPTFCVQESNDASPWHEEDDPFAPLPSQTDQILGNSSSQQQHFLHEQQLWLQNQNKIMARHADVF